MRYRRFLAGFVFVTGMAVTAIEITASRALAPFFGTSLFVWANVIGVVLLALALGYSIGGRLADRQPSVRLLAILTLTAGVVSAIIPVAVRAVATSLLAATTIVSAVLIVLSLLATLVLFFPPVFLLGMVTPFAIRLTTHDVGTSGRVAGNLFAASTVGSILGVMLPAFVTIPLLGVRETFFLASGLLIIAASLLFGRRAPLAALALAVPIVLFFATRGTPLRPGERVLDERDSAYQYIRVVEDDDGIRSLRINDGLGVQSLYRDDLLLYDSYFDYYSVLPYLLTPRTDLKVLLVGLAGGTIARQYDEIVGKDFSITMDGVEIDPEVVQTAREYFALDRGILNVHVADGRAFVAASAERYDIIIVDAYTQQIYIPPHLTTAEFFGAARERLGDNGVFAININVFQDDAELLARMLATLAGVFPEVRFARLPDLTNVLVMASNEPLEYDDVAARVPELIRPQALVVSNAAPPSERQRNASAFSDNRAPIELLTESMFFDLLLKLNHG
ncbi:MAG: fused MFS/spermidine synthase [Candidatus Kerfeldbacteria bacterium]|nr:fused MFS/spermidine synthase [Candidatus Kerfeldbacteria bacterium]